MAGSRVAGRYAKSLINQALESSKIDEVYSDVSGFLKVAGQRDFLLMLKSPVISKSSKAAIFSKLFSGKISDVFSNFLDIILRKNREAILPDVMEAFVDQYNELKKRTKIKITTAAPLDQAQIEAVKKQIVSSQITHPDLEVTTEVDESLLGGFSLDVGDNKYDASVRAKLDALRKSFAN